MIEQIFIENYKSIRNAKIIFLTRCSSKRSED